MFDGRMKESHHSTLGISPSSISFLGAISASLVDAWIPVFFAAWEISFCNLSNWACSNGTNRGELKNFNFQQKSQPTELKTDQVAYNILDEASKTDFKVIITKS